MEDLNKTSWTLPEWQQSLQKIKDYILSLLNKKKKRQEEERKEPTKKEIEDVLKSKSEEELKKKESIRDKLKKKLFDEEESTKERDKKSWKPQTPSKGWFELPQEDRDEYVPQDSEFWEALGESPRFAEIHPPFLGYYAQGKKSYFNKETNLRSKKKILSNLEHTLSEWCTIHTYAGVLTSGTNAIPLPDGALPDINSLCFHGKYPPAFQIDQNNCVYLTSKEKQYVSFSFGRNQVTNTKAPIIEDREQIIFSSLSDPTQQLLKSLWSKSRSLDTVHAIKQHIIRTKKYSTKVQWTLRNKSNSKNYVQHLDESPLLECFSANTLFVALCRELWFSARLVVGHMIQSVSKEGKAHLTSNNGHARSEIRDEVTKQWIRFDATPTVKEDGDKSNENAQEDKKDENDKSGEQAEDNFWDQESQESDQESKKKEQWEFKDNSKMKQKAKQSSKSPSEMLDELIEKAKEDNLTQQAEQMKDALDKLEQAKDKNEAKQILDKAWLTEFAKDMIDDVGNKKILEEEKQELEKIDNEKVLDEKLKDSLLNEEYKEKLKQYAKVLKDKIEEQKKKLKSEMDRMWFKEQEMALYKEYKQLEKEVEPEVRKQIAELKKILPPTFQILKDEEQNYRSGYTLNGSRLADYEVTGDANIFQRNREVREENEINMFETILIDRSWSMGNFNEEGSIFRESVKAAIIRSKVLEFFKVDFSIVIFDDSIDEVMTFWEKFSSRGKCLIPSKLMRACTTRSWGNSQEPISYVYTNMKKLFKQRGGKSFGNISFIGDGDLYGFQQLPTLKAMIDDLKKTWFGVTAYYINREERKMPLISYYFGTEENGWAIYAGDTKELSSKIIESHRKHLKNSINKYIK